MESRVENTVTGHQKHCSNIHETPLTNSSSAETVQDQTLPAEKPEFPNLQFPGFNGPHYERFVLCYVFVSVVDSCADMMHGRN